ncbi:sensor domain-containing protein [Paenibacillus koleovorans]|uniref:sensor domain-containing protein n=1 Tax=Paenibacillus koleovorans TaxID=121608 RepID=UPI0013E2A41C|nr:sensor domain-containing protein [Paenibacillus koleovorans]
MIAVKKRNALGRFDAVLDLLGLLLFRTAYLIIAMPLAIVGFVLTVTLLAVGVGLMPLGIGFFIYWFGLFVSDAMYVVDNALVTRLVRSRGGEPLAQERLQTITLRRMFVEKSYYKPVLYHLVKLPVSIVQFASTITFVICGFAMLFTPLVYVILTRLGIPMYAEDDVVMQVVFPNWSGMEVSYLGSALGVVFLVIGLAIVPKLLRIVSGFYGETRE